MKPLEWSYDGGGDFPHYWGQSDAFPSYGISRRYNRYILQHPFGFHLNSEHGTLEAAKAAAQADYERRILSALSQPHPADERSASDVICEECGHLVSPREATWTEDGSPFHAKCLPAEAENARLRALPLKDEVERELRKAHGETMGEAGNALLDKSVDGRIKANWLGGKANGLGVALDVLSRLRAGEQEGWKLVPVETTRAMRDAGFKILSELDDADPTQVMDVRPSAVWEAMLAAAPKQGEAK